jgi:DNA repair protein RecN (Recombination protein N)
MLLEINIENFAIIDRLELAFQPGLVTFTGETGAGKSIIIDAVETLLGGRADSSLIRTGAERALVEATFSLSEGEQQEVLAILEREDLADTLDTVVLAREIRRSGRNIARINGRSVTTGLLNELGSMLVDVHGQSEHLSLLKVRQHLKLLDRFALLEDILVNYSEKYRRWQHVRKELEELRRSERDAARRADLLQYQINEIEAARLKIGEEEELKDERNRLANAEGLASFAAEALLILEEGSPESPAVSDLLGQTAHSLSSLARLDPSQESLVEQIQLITDNLSELSSSLQGYQENIEFNPRRLDHVEERLALIQNLKRKYGANLEAVLDFEKEARRQFEEISHAGERIETLEAELASLVEEIGELGRSLTKKRQEAANQLAQAVQKELEDLQMGGALFQVDFQSKPDPNGALNEAGQRVAFDSTGMEQVEFLVALNPGEGLKPLVKVASGGETSRLMLALKNVLASADEVPTLIFDEIDQGIGGRVGSVVGRKLWNLSAKHQVLCITHLPQLAAFGQQHFRVQKKVIEGRTSTVAEVVEGQDRKLELAQMMGGISEGTFRSAEELLASVASLNS